MAGGYEARLRSYQAYYTLSRDQTHTAPQILLPRPGQPCRPPLSVLYFDKKILCNDMAS